jgi:hypothetical protein
MKIIGRMTMNDTEWMDECKWMDQWIVEWERKNENSRMNENNSEWIKTKENK